MPGEKAASSRRQVLVIDEKEDQVEAAEVPDHIERDVEMFLVSSDYVSDIFQELPKQIEIQKACEAHHVPKPQIKR